MKSFLTLDDLSPQGKVVLLRADLNVPMQGHEVTETMRIDRLVPTLKELSSKGARVVILSHFGRPKGKDDALSLAPVCRALSKAYGANIPFVHDCIGDLPRQAIARMKDGDVILLENVRFYPEEEKNDLAFAKKLASLGNVYVNDAFSCAHRAHATTHRLAELLPAYAGRLMEAELNALESVVGNPKPPVTAIVGGAKISTKLALLNNLVTRIDTLVLGGGMANTFLAALGSPVGKSLCEREMKQEALDIMDTAEKSGCRILLPVDCVAATEFRAHADTRATSVDAIDDNEMMLDIGPDTVSLVRKVLAETHTVLWNGPVGAFETPPFDQGTTALAKIVAELTQSGKMVSVAGGGDTVAALSHAGVDAQMTYVSTAGGAFLEWLEGQTLPGVDALQTRAKRA